MIIENDCDGWLWGRCHGRRLLFISLVLILIMIFKLIFTILNIIRKPIHYPRLALLMIHWQLSHNHSHCEPFDSTGQTINLAKWSILTTGGYFHDPGPYVLCSDEYLLIFNPALDKWRRFIVIMAAFFLCSLVNYSLHIFILINCGKYSPGADTEHMAAAPDISVWWWMVGWRINSSVTRGARLTK